MNRVAIITRSLKQIDVRQLSISAQIGSNLKIEKIIRNSCKVWKDFITKQQETIIIEEIEPILR